MESKREVVRMLFILVASLWTNQSWWIVLNRSCIGNTNTGTTMLCICRLLRFITVICALFLCLLLSPQRIGTVKWQKAAYKCLCHSTRLILTFRRPSNSNNSSLYWAKSNHRCLGLRWRSGLSLGSCCYFHCRYVTLRNKWN